MLTSRQRDTLVFIIDYQRENQFSPSYADICDGIGLKSKSGVNRLVMELQERGFLTMMPHRSRTIKVLKAPAEMLRDIEAV